MVATSKVSPQQKQTIIKRQYINVKHKTSKGSKETTTQEMMMVCGIGISEETFSEFSALALANALALAFALEASKAFTASEASEAAFPKSFGLAVATAAVAFAKGRAFALEALALLAEAFAARPLLRASDGTIVRGVSRGTTDRTRALALALAPVHLGTRCLWRRAIMPRRAVALVIRFLVVPSIAVVVIEVVVIIVHEFPYG